MKIEFKKSLFWWIAPIYINFIFELIFSDFRPDRWINFLENHVFLVILFVFINLHSVFKTKFMTGLFYLGFGLTCGAETLYYFWFGTNFSASAIFVLFETNLAEAREFLSFYFNAKSIFLIAVHLLLILGFFIKYRNSISVKILRQKKWICLSVFIALLAVFKFSHLIDQNFPYLLARGIIVYQYEHFQLKDLPLDKQESFLSEVEHIGDDEATYVLVIGESASRNHLTIYGYDRATTPFLTSLKPEINIYTDVISNSAFTIGSLKKVLTYNHFQKDKEATLVQLMNQAGFTTFWISNQRPVGPYESLVTKISKASHHVHYTNTAIAGSVTPHDEVILPYFEKALNNPAKKKFIIIHLLGSHLQYKDRYPKEFDVFHNKASNLVVNTDEAVQKRNTYDNSITYTDFMLKEIFKSLQTQKGEKNMLYFSDHGEEVYQTRSFAGHYEENPSPPMFEVPFLFWTSDDYFKNYGLTIDTKRTFMLNYFFDTYADFSKIKFKQKRKRRSLFSEEFKLNNRLLNSGIHYEKLVR
ncbi:MAG: sulfatase-like hydrolase/transferase [Psychroflexus maritimus]